MARKQLDAEAASQLPTDDDKDAYSEEATPERSVHDVGTEALPGLEPPVMARRYHGSVSLDPTRVGRDAGKIADEVVAHLAGLTGADVRLTLEIEADIPNGAPEQVVRVVTENSKTLKFEDTGFESE